MAHQPELQFQEAMSDLCNQCGSLKKRDPATADDVSGDGQPQLKKQEISSVSDYLRHGFSKVAVPSNFQPCLSRTGSDPANSLGADQPKQPSSQNFSNSRQRLMINSNVPVLPPSPAKGGSTEFPLLSPLRRTISEPLPAVSPSGTGVTQYGPGETTGGYPLRSQENLDPERFKRVMEKMKEMKQRWREVMLEVEDAESHVSDTNQASDTEREEEVSIEMTGEYLSVLLKCPCSKGYQFLISGSNCYYKLM